MLYRKEAGRERVKRSANLICAFPFVLAEHLGAKVEDDWAHLVSEEEEEETRKANFLLELRLL
jgi:hypothetical protein